MKLQHLIILLIMGIYFSEAQAMKPRKGGATGGAAATSDISKCELNASKQTKVKLTGKDGKVHFICTGQAVCRGKTVPVSCKVSERESCPISTKCIRFIDDDPVLSIPIKVVIQNSMDTLKFWTKDKIKQAKPLPIPVIKGEAPKKIFKNMVKKILAEPTNINDFKGGDSEQGKGTPISPELFKQNSIFYPSGKVFSYRENESGGNTMVFCSGSTTKIGDKTVIVTAAHCVVNPDGIRPDILLNKRIQFIQDDGYPDLEKVIYAKSVVILRAWIPGVFESKSKSNYDLALIEVGNSPILNCCHGLMTSNLFPPGISLGYPMDPPFPPEGKTMYYLKIQDFINENTIKNNFTDGASGGPWIGHFENRGKYGYISGINSHRFESDQPEIMHSPMYWYLIEDLAKCLKKEIPCDEFPVNN